MVTLFLREHTTTSMVKDCNFAGTEELLRDDDAAKCLLSALVMRTMGIMIDKALLTQLRLHENVSQIIVTNLRVKSYLHYE